MKKVDLSLILLSEEAAAAWQEYVGRLFEGLRLARLVKDPSEIVQEAEIKGSELILHCRWSGKRGKKAEAEMAVPSGHWQWRAPQN